MIILLGIFCILIIGIGSVYFIKYIRLKNKVNLIIKELNKPLRKGYYDHSLKYGGVTFECQISVSEVEKYSNDLSKIKLDSIDYGVNGSVVSHAKIKEYVIDTFKTIVKTSDVIWLDIDQSIKESRKQKLENLKKSLK
jgi:hypothetical protein